MRPKNKTIPLKNLPYKSLKYMLKKKKTPDNIKQKIYQILAERDEKNWEFAQKFFDPRYNKFWQLARYQLKREGKAKEYGTGKHRLFSIGKPLRIFDKMIEIKKKHDKYQTGKVKAHKELALELNSWKR